MDISVLGPLRVEDARGPVDIRGAKERLLLARLAAARGHVVPTSDLVDTLWGEDPPASAAKSLQTFVLRLRNALEPDRGGRPSLLVTDGRGYRLEGDPTRLDADRFARLVELGSRALEDGQPDAAAVTLDQALALWRGPAYAGFEDAPFAAAESRRLEELRLTASEARAAADLARGRPDGTVAELERLVTEHPLRERAWELLVTALYRAGRQGDALGAYDRARTVLADELGVDPGPGLRAVHARVLAHDPTLGSPASRARLPAGLRPARLLVDRDAELARLRGAWESALRDGPATVVVRGPAGAGGTALAAALAADVARGGARVVLLEPTSPGAPHSGPSPGSEDEPPSATPVLVVADRVHPPAATPAPTLTLVLAGEHAEPGTDVRDVVDLTPLTPAGIRDVVAQYVEAAEVDDAAAEVALRTSGWAAEVHALALDHARALTTRRVNAAAAVTGATSASLAAARAELADGITALRDSPGDGSATVDPRDCPWRGLAAYDVDDARWFHGRERLVAETVARLAGARFVALVGASGSGKSSTLRAGLLAALGQDVLAGSAGWRLVTLRPGPHPLRELARQALGHRGRDEVADLLSQLVTTDGVPETRVVVAVDQLEEAWTLCTDDGERAEFLDTLVELATDPTSPVSVVVAVRGDFLDRAADHAGLRPLVGDGTVLVGPMTPAELRRAVERPAALAGLDLDDGLADTVVSDAGAEPGLLPLLSTALAQLWERREGRALTYRGYVALGGLAGAIATLAEETYEGLGAAERTAARALLLRLAGPGEGAEATRRRVAVAEVGALPAEGTHTVIDQLVSARLLTLSDGHLEVAHEALFREWPRLRGWLTEDAAGRAAQHRLALAAAEWDAEGRDPSLVWGGTRLAAGLDAVASRPDEVTSTERDFLEAGREALDAERREAEERAASTARQNRRLRHLVVGIAAVLAVALVAGLLAWRSRQEAQSATVSAEAKRLAASALNIEYPDVALLSAVEATKLEQSPETYGALLTLLARQPKVVHRMRVADRFLRLAVSADGRSVYLGENLPRIRAVDAESGRLLWARDMPRGGQVGNITPTPDGRGLLVTELADEPGVLRLDASSGDVEWEVREDAMTKAAPDVQPWVTMGGLTADGRYLVNTDSHVLTIDPGTGRVTAAAPWPEPMPFTTLFRVWPDGRVSRERPGDVNTALVLDPRRPARGTSELVGTPISFSPDGTRMALVREVATVSDLRVAEVADPAGATTDWVRMSAFVSGAGWSPDGSRMVVTTADGIQLVDPKTLALGATASGHSGTVMDVRFAGPASDLVWTAGRDGTAVAFDLSGTRTPIATRPAEPEPHVGRSAPSAGLGVYLDLLEQDPNTAFVTDLRTGRNLGRLDYDLGPAGESLADDVMTQVAAVAITPDGSTALVGLEAFVPGQGVREPVGFVVVFDARTRSQRSVLRTPWAVFGLAVTPDGRRAVVNGERGTGIVDLSSGRLVGAPTPMPEMRNVDWTMGAEVSRDGRLAALARNAEVVLVDVATGREVRRGRVAEDDERTVQGLAWSADSSTIAAGSDAGWLHVVSASTLSPVAPQRLVTGGWVSDLEVSPDGAVMASVGSDGDTTLWDTATWRPYGQPVTDDRLWGWLTFSGDSRRLRVFFEEGESVDISVDRDDWVTAACAAAGRNLSPEESAVVLPGQPVRPTCPDAT